MKYPRLFIATGLVALSLVPLSAAEPAAVVPDPGFSIDKMDRSVDPRVDFARFAAGGWYAKNEIPSDKARWGGFNELAERTWSQVRAIVEESAAHPGAPGSVKQKVGDLFASATDTAAINALGLKPIQAELDAIAAANSLAELFGPAMRLQLGVGGPFFSPAFFADQKQSEIYGFYLFQGGMSLPSKEYYFSEKFARERWEFTGHVARMLELAGTPRATAYKDAETVFALEKALAENAKLPVELRDRLANYNKMTVAEAAAAYPGLPLAQVVSGLGVPATAPDVIIGQPKFFEGLSKLLQERPLDEWKVYLRWQLLTASAPYLSDKFDDENFRFFGTVLNGTPQQEPRWQRAAKIVDTSSARPSAGSMWKSISRPPPRRGWTS